MAGFRRGGNTKFFREYLRGGNISSRGKKQRHDYGNNCLSFPPARGVTVNKNAGVNCYRQRHDGAGKQEPTVAREFPSGTKCTDGQRRPKSAGNKGRGKRCYDKQFPAHRNLIRNKASTVQGIKGCARIS